jgi:hypothetical protein
MDAKAYASVIKEICIQLRIAAPDTNLIRNVTQYCKQLNHAYLKTSHRTEEALYKFISQAYIDSLAAQNQSFDYSEYLRDKSTTDKAYANQADLSIQPFTNWIGDRMPVLSSKSMSVYIDSRARDISNDRDSAPITDFAFTLVPRQSHVRIDSGRIQARIMPSQVTFFKVGQIILPYPAQLRTRNYMTEITLTFTALRSNGIIGNADTYHFAFTYQPMAGNNDLVLLTPVDKYCKFNPPLRLVDDLSMRFNDPILPIGFVPDRIKPSLFNYITTDGRIVFNSQHELSTGSVIVVDGLTTLGDNVKLLETINDPRGIVITKIDDYIISTGIDFSSIVLPDVQSLPLIRVYSRTFRFPLEIGYQNITELDV